MLWHLVDVLKQGGVTTVVVVVGYQYHYVLGQHAELAASPGVIFQFNPNFATGEMLSSVQAGLRALDPREYSAFLVCPVDMPLITGDVVSALIRAHENLPQKIIVPLFKGRKGHPVLFPMELYWEIVDLPATAAGLKLVQEKHPSQLQLLELECEGVLMDLDTPAEYERLKTRADQHSL